MSEALGESSTEEETDGIHGTIKVGISTALEFCVGNFVCRGECTSAPWRQRLGLPSRCWDLWEFVVAAWRLGKLFQRHTFK